MDSLDVWPYFTKMAPDTFGAEANYGGNDRTALAAMLARAKVGTPEFKECFLKTGHDFAFRKAVVIRST